MSQEKLENYTFLVKKYFSFLEKEFDLVYYYAQETGKPHTRDHGLVTCYYNKNLRTFIGWSEEEKSLVITIRFDNANLSKNQKYAYFEPLIEFLTEEEPIVPYIKEKSSISAIESVLDERAILFSQGLEPVLKKLAEKLQNNFEVLQSVSQEQLKNYHRWMLSEKISCKKTLAPRISQKGATF